ncbi:MAG: spore germination protein [Armatimonadetes bacterium]|nr:spore germination protein [Armatimonadota bacterium]
MLPIVINIFFLKINVIQTGSALNIGENYLGEWSSVSKVNSGTGSLYGDQSIQDSQNVCLDDSDLFDMPVLKETSGSNISDCLRRV